MTPQNQAAEPTPRELSHIFINSNEPGLYDSSEGGEHKVILQALNRYITYGSGKDQTSIYYGIDNFIGTEPAWDKTAVIFQEDGVHPDLNEFERDPAAALKKINGKPAGMFRSSAVLAGPGQPRLESFIKFSDPEVEKLYNAGELALSTALFCHLQNNKLDGQVRPNHVLLFKPGKTQPRDLGSMFLNSIFLESNDPKEGEIIDKLDKILTDFTNSVKGLFNSGGGGTGDGGDGGDGGNGGGSGGGDGGQGNGGGGSGGSGGTGGGNNGGNDGGQALANALAVKDQENKDLAAKNAALEAELKNARQAEADRVWNALKNTNIPPGLVKTPEEEAALRQLYNTDRDNFWLKVLAVKQKAPNTGKEGEQFTNSEKFEQIKKVNDAWDKQTGATIRIGGN